MTRIPLPYPEMSLLLSPDSSVPTAFPLVLIVLLPVVLAVWLSSYDFRGLRPGVAVGLTLLRLLGLVGMVIAGSLWPGLMLPLVCLVTVGFLVWLFVWDFFTAGLAGALGWLTARLLGIGLIWGVGLLVPSGLLPLLFVVSVGLVGWLCWYELQVVRRSAALFLLSLRLGVIFLLWFLLSLQPILARSTTEELPGRVLLAVDRSASMDVADPQRETADKLRLARALKLTGDVSSAQLDAWIRAAESKQEPQWVEEKEFPDAPDRRRQLAEQRRQQHTALLQQIDALTRTEVTRRLLAADGGALLSLVAGKHNVELLGFAQERWEIKPDQLQELFRSPASGEREPPEGKVKEMKVPSGGSRPALATFRFTDLHLPLARALERGGPDQGKILGVVILTDGQHNWGPSPVPRAIELGEQKVPVYPVAVGGRKPPPDLAVVTVKAPTAIFKDVDITVEARVKVTGLPAGEIVVELPVPGKPEPERQTIQHDGSDRSYPVQFRVRLEKPGTHTLTVTAKPLKGETRTDNNSRPVVVNVAEDQAKVLLVDGEPRWEYHYLATALARDRTMKVQSVVFQQPRIGAVPEAELKKLGLPERSLPAEPDALTAFDCIVLGDVSPAQLPLPERRRLEKYVADRGGTLVILAGKRSMPLAFLEAGKGAGEEGDPLLNLLPVESPQAVAPVRGFPLTFTEEGKLRTQFLEMEETPEGNTRRWAELPPHYWGVVGRAKKNAVVLSYVAEERFPGVEPDPTAEERNRALLVRQNYGFGRVLFVGLDSTWRWRFKVGDTYHHRFWGQLVRWAASDKPLVAGNEHVRFGSREPVYKQGQEVDLVVRLGDELGSPGRPPLGPDALAGARILRSAADGKPEETLAVVPLRRLEAQPHVLEGRVKDLPAGLYQVELAIPDLADKLQGSLGPDGKPVPLRAAFTVTPPDSEELTELATNWALLDELAAKSGGKVFTPENANELVEKLRSQTITHEHRTERKLWQEWPTLVLFLMLLTTEWVGRKLAGLP